MPYTTNTGQSFGCWEEDIPLDADDLADIYPGSISGIAEKGIAGKLEIGKKQYEDLPVWDWQVHDL